MRTSGVGLRIGLVYLLAKRVLSALCRRERGARCRDLSLRFSGLGLQLIEPLARLRSRSGKGALPDNLLSSETSLCRCCCELCTGLGNCRVLLLLLGAYRICSGERRGDLGFDLVRLGTIISHVQLDKCIARRDRLILRH